jgi:hypothetical protein
LECDEVVELSCYADEGEEGRGEERRGEERRVRADYYSSSSVSSLKTSDMVNCAKDL